MPYKIPPTHCLTAFEAIVRLRTVVQAAEELHVTPSAISHRIRQLEEMLGAKLFARNGNDFSLTVDGKQYLVKVKQGLDILNQTPGLRDASQEKRKLRVAVTPTFARQILMPRLTELSTAYPEIDLVLQVSIPFLDVKAEECDIEIRYGSGPYPGMITHELLTDTVTPVCSSYYLQRHGLIATPDQLANCALLRSPLSPWRDWFVTAGLNWPEPREGTQFNDVGLLMDAAANSQGVALARVTLCQQWIERGQLLRLFSLDAPSPYAHYLTCKPEMLDRWECASFIDWLLKTLRPHTS